VDDNTVMVMINSISPLHVGHVHGRPQKIFQRGGKVDTLLILFSLLAWQRKWTYTKMSNVTAAVTYSVFPIRKFYTEKILF